MASSSALSSISCCAGPLGAVREADLPSWFTAPPTTATTPPAEEEEEEEESRRHCTASALVYPFAEASSVLHLPSGASIPALWISWKVLRDTSALDPHASALSGDRGDVAVVT